MISRRYFLFAILIVALFLASRLLTISSLPVFGDEAIYIRWSQIIRSVETLRFIPLTDGKAPLFMWLTTSLLKFFSDPLLAGRVLSVLSGLGSLLLLGYLSYPSLIAPLIYLLSPYSLLFDNLALADNLLSFFGLLAFALVSRLSARPRLDLSLILGLVFGLALVTKSPAIFFIVLSFVFLLTSPQKSKFTASLLLSSLIGYTIFNLLRLGPQFHQIGLRSLDYVWPLGEVIKHPLDPFKPHAQAYLKLLWSFFSPILLLSFLSPKPSSAKTKYYSFFPLLWWLLPTLAVLATTKVFTGRYLLFSLPYLYLLLDRHLRFHRLPIKLLLLSSQAIVFGYFFYYYAFSPFHLSLPTSESGYVSSWTSGWGIKPAFDYLDGRRQHANIIVGTEGYFGSLPQGLEIYANQLPGITIVGQGLGLTQVPDSLLNSLVPGNEVYLLVNRSRHQLSPSTLRLQLIRSFPKPDSDYLDLYQII